mgnify:CR=1 FL=1
MKKKRNIIIVISIVLVLCIGAGIGVGAWILTRDNGTVAEAGLEPLDSDPGNVAYDDWTARY